MKKLFYPVLFSLLFTGLNAQNLVTENFNYGSTSDTLTNPAIGGTLWKRHSGSGGAISYLTTSLSYAGYPASGTGGSVSFMNASGSREDANIAIPPVTSGSVYTSFLMNVTASGGSLSDYMIHLNDSQGVTITTAFRGKLWIKDGVGVNKFVLGITKGGAVGAAVWTGDLDLNTTYLVVLKYVFVPGATNDSTNLYLFSSGVPATEPVVPTLAATDITSQTDFAQVRSFCLRQGTAGTSAITLDGIRIGNSWNTSLPVKYSSFNATSKNNTIVLNWSTASEINSSRFLIERAGDGKNFEVIGKVTSTGNSTRTSYYSFNDNNPVKGMNFYRLKQVDVDGKAEYSKTVSVNNTAVTIANKAGIETTTPNPFNAELNVGVSVNTAGNAKVELIDMLGKQHYATTEMFNAGNNKVIINTASLPDGIYFVRISQNGETFTQKIIKR